MRILWCYVLILFFVIDYGVYRNWKIKSISFFDCFENFDRNDKRWRIQNLWENDDKVHIRNIQIKYKIIDLFQPNISTFSTRDLIWVNYKIVH